MSEARWHPMHRTDTGSSPWQRALLVACAGVLVLSGCDENPLDCTNPQSNGTWPYDIKWCHADDNGFPLNPFYYGGPFLDPQKSTLPDGNAQNFAHDVKFDSHWYNDPNLQFMSHTLGTAFTGRCMNWEGPVDDGDCCLDLLTPWLAGINLRNQQTATSYLHLEFLTEETLSNFDGNSGWKRIHQTDAATVSRQLQNAQVIATGIWGMDFGHGDIYDGKAELHPVLAFAIQTTSRPQTGGPEIWQFFARRRADNNHGTTWEADWANTELRFPLAPGLANAPHADDLWASSSGVSASLDHSGDHVLLALRLPDVSDWVCGTLVIPYGRSEATGGATAQKQRLEKMIDSLALTPKQAKELSGHVREANSQVRRMTQSWTKFQTLLKSGSGSRKEAAVKERLATAPPTMKTSFETHLTEFQSARNKLDSSVRSVTAYVNQSLSAKQRNIVYAYLEAEVGTHRLMPQPAHPGQHTPRVRAVKSAVTKAQREKAAREQKNTGGTSDRAHGKRLPKVVAKKAPDGSAARGKASAGSRGPENAHALGSLPSQAAMPVLEELSRQAEKSLAERANMQRKK